MSLVVACTQCGKTYAAPETSVGKRARCKACGHVFVVPGRLAAATRSLGPPPMPASGPRMGDQLSPRPTRPPPPTPTVRPPPPPVAYEDPWSSLEQAVTDAEIAIPRPPVVVAGNRATDRPASGHGRTGKAFGWFRTAWNVIGWLNGEDQILLGLALLAAVTFLVTLAVPPVAVVACLVFLALAVLYLLGGVFIVSARSARTGTSVRLDWSFPNVLLILALGVLVYYVISRLLEFLLRGTINRDVRSMVSLLLLFVKAGVVAGFGVWIFQHAERSGLDRQPVPTTMEHRVATLGPRAPGASTPTFILSPDQFPQLHRPFDGAFNAAPVLSAPMDGGAVDSAEAARLTVSNLETLFSAEIVYQNRHRLAVPPSLDALAEAVGWPRPPASPFDPASAESGYVFLPLNVSAPPFRVMFYDAAELRLTGQTHVIYRPGRRVTVLARDELAAEPGVSLP